MDLIKEAFSKIKKDISSLKQEISSLKFQIETLTQTFSLFNLNDSNSNRQTDKQTQNPALNPLKDENLDFSIGNEGVPTDKQTNRQTDKQTQNPTYFSDFSKASKMLDSLDNIKKGIRLKFKRLTTQEMVIFSKLYTLEEENLSEITYRTLSIRLNLSESSIRDYINKLIKKGIPIEKIKQNNKTIILKISQDLKNIVTLNKIIQLRGL